MHLLCINTELAFAVDNVSTSYFREQQPRCQSCAGHCLSQLNSHQEHLCKGRSHRLFLLSVLCSCPLELQPHLCTNLFLRGPVSPPTALGTALEPCSGACWPKPVLHVSHCIPSQSFQWFYHLKPSRGTSSAARPFKVVCCLLEGF